MRGNLLRVDPGIEQNQLEWALMTRQHSIEERLATATGDRHARLLANRDAIKRVRERLNQD